MLDSLLVLGQIPGTNFQVSFWELVIGSLGVWLYIRVWRRPAVRRKYVYLFRLTAFYIYHFRSFRQRQN